MRTCCSCLLLLFCMVSCKKFLNKPANSSSEIPSTVAGFQEMMDQKTLTAQCTPGLGPMYMSDYRVSSDTIIGSDPFLTGLYTWQPVLIKDKITPSWGNPYQAIYVCNTVITELPKLTGLDSADQAAARFVLGQAYFVRAFLYFNLEETFGQPCRSSSAATDAGVPLRLDENAMAHSSRATVAAVFKQIVSDLSQAVNLLPAALQTNNRNRPCASAAYGLLARTWLTLGDSAAALQNAQSALLLYDRLLDYNTIDSTSSHPFPASGNGEVLFQSSTCNYPPLQYGRTIFVDSTLYGSYSGNDLRRAVYFQAVSSTGMVLSSNPRGIPTGGAPSTVAGYFFKASYTGSVYVFSGISVDELFFIRAECKARTGDIAGAMGDLNALLSTRWRRGTFQPFSAATRDAALRLILQQKHMEMVFREEPFYDLRRLNQDPAFSRTMTRTYNGLPYTLLPSSPYYAFPIPTQEIDASGIPQNPEE